MSYQVISSSSCRICLKSGCFISLSNKINNKLISESIQFVTGIQIQDKQKSRFPTKICDYCLQNICMAENIKKISLDSDKYLKSILGCAEEVKEDNPDQRVSQFVKEEESDNVIIEYEVENKATESSMSIKKDLELEINDEILNVFDNDNHFESPVDDYETETRNHGSMELDDFDVIEDEVQVQEKKPDIKYRVERVFPCAYCGKEFKTEGMVNKHELSHTGEKKFECDKCGMKFLHKAYVNNHLRVVHLRIKNFKCETCGFLMYSKTHYRDHKKTHDPEPNKEEECSVCSKRFIRKHSLLVHMRIHTGERPYKCEYCPNTYMHGTDLKRHVMTHTGERPYKCQYCDRGFIKRSCLTSHENTHRKIVNLP